MTFDEEVEDAFKKFNKGYLNKDMRYNCFYNGYKMCMMKRVEPKFYVNADEIADRKFLKYYLSNGAVNAEVNIIADCYDDMVECKKILELPPNLVEIERKFCYGQEYIVTGYFNEL